uniref:PDZ domain-containing protein n=1 Tax=Amphimedon queenslandica TaxID=400682 RepID=A0A1X7U4Y4_AMPQE
MAFLDSTLVEENGEKNGFSSHPPLGRSWTLDSPRPSREELIKIVRKAGLPTNSNQGPSYSEPSSPRKILRRINSDRNSESSGSSRSSTTLTSDDEEKDESLAMLEDIVANNRGLPSLLITDDNAPQSGEFRARSGSRFYHESFTDGPSQAPVKPAMFIPSSRSAHQLVLPNYSEKKKKSLITRIRRTIRGKKPKTVDKKSIRRWVDYEDELDPVSRPSYFRHIGHVISAGPGNIKTVQLNKPPHGKFGIFVAQGVDPARPQEKKSVFVSRFYEENASMFYASLLRPGDEILAINGVAIRDKPLSEVIGLFEGCQTVQLTILPYTGLPCTQL